MKTQYCLKVCQRGVLESLFDLDALIGEHRASTLPPWFAFMVEGQVHANCEQTLSSFFRRWDVTYGSPTWLKGL